MSETACPECGFTVGGQNHEATCSLNPHRLTTPPPSAPSPIDVDRTVAQLRQDAIVSRGNAVTCRSLAKIYPIADVRPSYTTDAVQQDERAEMYDRLAASLPAFVEDAARYRYIRERGVILGVECESYKTTRLDAWVDTDLWIDVKLEAARAARLSTEEREP